MTSFQVEEDKDLPDGVCRECSESGMAAFAFRRAFRESHKQWAQAADFLSTIQGPCEKDKVYYIFYNSNERTIVGDQTEFAQSKEKAVVRLNSQFQDTVHEDAKPIKRNRKKLLHRELNCPDCGKKFSVSSFLNSHLRNTLKRACNECGQVLPKSRLADHISVAHGMSVFSCGICHNIFEDLQNLNCHFLEDHSNSKFQCQVCGVSFNNERALSAHTYSHSLFHCESCGKCYENRKCFMHHKKQCKYPSIRSIGRVNRYVCDYCNASYTKKPSLRIHIIQKHLRVLPYVCETCGKRTSTIAHLRSHELTHKLQRTIFKCDCGAVMRTELGFHLHQRIHTGEKPYKCEECGDRFLSSSRRLDHIKRRHRSAKDMPHACKECTARFVRPFELKKHYRSVHSRGMLQRLHKRAIVNPDTIIKLENSITIE